MPKMSFAGTTARYTRDQREAAAEALERLHDSCDGAHALDGSGFNKWHADNAEVQDLCNEAALTGEVPEEEMGFALSVLKTYKNTQLQDLAGRLWP